MADETKMYWWDLKDLAGFAKALLSALLNGKRGRVEFVPSEGMLYVVTTDDNDKGEEKRSEGFNWVHNCPPDCGD